jgi:hypothetical protein
MVDVAGLLGTEAFDDFVCDRQGLLDGVGGAGSLCQCGSKIAISVLALIYNFSAIWLFIYPVPPIQDVDNLLRAFAYTGAMHLDLLRCARLAHRHPSSGCGE